MPEFIKPDICVIGAGSGGLSVAAAAALFGVKVVLIERHLMGGDCLNVGCVPSKALIAAAHRAHDIRNAGPFGLVAPSPQVHFARVQDHVRQVIAAIAPTDSVERFAAMGVRVIQGEARFLDNRSVTVGSLTIQARRFVLATGSRPTVPPIDGLESVPYLTNESVFDLTARPERLIVLGGGPIGVELGQAFARLGSRVAIIQSGRILPRDEEEAAIQIRRALAADGVELREQARAVKVEGAEGALSVTLDSGERLAGTHLLVAAGRRPSLDSLDLAAAGVTTEERGVVVDRGLRTSNRRIYAIGDCAAGATEGLQFTHVANYHAGLVVRSALFRLPARIDNRAIPRVTYCDPEVASVGLTEEAARKAGHQVQLLRWPFAENDRAQAERATDGLVKLVTNRKGRILGVTIIGRGAGELLMPWVIAIQKGWSTREMVGLVFPYPTFSEVSKRAALLHFGPMAQKPWIRRIIRFLSRFG